MESLEKLETLFEKGLKDWQEEIFVKKAGVVGLNAIAQVKALTPVKTGLLRRRWFHKVEKRDGAYIIWISNNTKYAAAVNYGRRITKGKKTVGKTKGKYMLEQGLRNYENGTMHQDIRNMLLALKESLS